PRQHFAINISAATCPECIRLGEEYDRVLSALQPFSWRQVVTTAFNFSLRDAANFLKVVAFHFPLRQNDVRMVPFHAVIPVQRSVMAGYRWDVFFPRQEKWDMSIGVSGIGAKYGSDRGGREYAKPR